METRLEVDRLREVYGEYASRGWARSKWSAANRGNQLLSQEREARVCDRLQRSGLMPLAKRRVLDVGCGTGELLSRFLRWGATPSNLFGVDLMPERIRAARQAHPGIDFRLANAETLPFPDSHFDLVSVFTVFTSILDPRMAANMSAEIRRILQAGGRVLWYDFRYNNPFNPNVRAYSKSRILQLFPGFTVELETITLLPPLVRRLGPLTGLLYGPLNRLPCLRSHWLGILTKH